MSFESSGLPDAVWPHARQTPVAALPHDTLLFLLGSRYCETDRLSEVAWKLFGNSPDGWGRVQAICDFVHGHLTFGYGFARNTKTAWEAYQERTGVCRDFAHLAVALCRCMNIPARYCAGYLGDIGVEVRFRFEQTRYDIPADDLFVHGVGLDVLVVEVFGGRSGAGAPHGLGQAP